MGTSHEKVREPTSPGVVVFRVMGKLVSGFEIQMALLKFLEEGFLCLHHGELQEIKHTTRGCALVGIHVCVCVRVCTAPGLCSRADSDVRC